MYIESGISEMKLHSQICLGILKSDLSDQIYPNPEHPRGLLQNPQNSNHKPEFTLNSEVHTHAPILILIWFLSGRPASHIELSKNLFHNSKPRDSLGQSEVNPKLISRF